MSSAHQLNFAPGSRVEIRDTEWRIKRIDDTTDGGKALTCVGISELVRDRETTFLTNLEDEIKLLAPEATKLQNDTSRGY